MKSIVVGDIHNHVEDVEEILSNYPGHRKIFVGDYFDNFSDTRIDAIRTAEWLKYSLNQPNRVHLLGNHDISYHPSNKKSYICSGYSHEKRDAINKILTPYEWDEIKLLHVEDNWHISHAGITKHWWCHPVTGYSDLIDRVNDVQKHLFDIYQPAVWEADFKRGGGNKVGGLLWCDWDNLNVINGINQIVGHTPTYKTLTKKYPTYNDNVNVCIDCFPQSILEINGNNYTIIELNRPCQYKR